MIPSVIFKAPSFSFGRVLPSKVRCFWSSSFRGFPGGHPPSWLSFDGLEPRPRACRGAGLKRDEPRESDQFEWNQFESTPARFAALQPVVGKLENKP